MLRYSKIAVALLLLGSTALGAASDGEWSHEADVRVKVNGHIFDHVAVEARKCSVAVRLHFDAPDKGYADGRNEVRNYHVFRARVKFASGQFVSSERFGNRAAGARTYEFEADTTKDGCWSNQRTTIEKLDVIGCRGRRCDTGSFP